MKDRQILTEEIREKLEEVRGRDRLIGEQKIHFDLYAERMEILTRNYISRLREIGDDYEAQRGLKDGYRKSLKTLWHGYRDGRLELIIFDLT